MARLAAHDAWAYYASEKNMNLPVLTLITTSFPIRGDGSEAAGSFVADLVDELAKHICVRVVAPGSVAGQETWGDNVQVVRYAAPCKPLSTLKPWRLGDLRDIVQVLRGGMQATRIAAQGSQHILALWALPSGAWAKQAAKELGISYSVWMLGSDVWSLGRIPVLRGMLARVIQQAKNAYADGYLLAADAKNISGRSIDFLPSTRRIGLKNSPVPRDCAPYRLLFLGRWHPNKGIDLLLDALAQLSQADWQRIEVVEIQGGGPMQSLVEEQIKTLQAQGLPVLLGRYLDKNEAEVAITRADWVLIPSRIESIPVVFSDAIKLGRPVVAMPVGDLPTLIENRSGILASEVSAAAYCQALQQAIHGSPEVFKVGVATCASQFQLDLLAKKIVEEVVSI